MNRKKLKTNEFVLYAGESDRHLQKQVECWLGEITPGVALRMEDYGHSNRIGLMVHQEGNIGADYFTAQNVGFGISYVLPVVLALVKAKDYCLFGKSKAHLHPRVRERWGN